jgi:hypothetical protein
VIGRVVVFGGDRLELAPRSSNGRGPLSQERLLSSIGLGAPLIAGASLLFLFALGVCLQILWQGRVPLTNRFAGPPALSKQTDVAAVVPPSLRDRGARAGAKPVAASFSPCAAARPVRRR